jgi:hypothetical protein
MYNLTTSVVISPLIMIPPQSRSSSEFSPHIHPRLAKISQAYHFFSSQTGNSLPLTDTPALSTNTPIQGPITGIFLANPAIVPRKSPNNINIPYSSTKKPTSAQRMRIRNRPPKKAAVPFSFCRRAKKSAVFWGPIIIVRPIRKRIFWIC